MSAIQTEKEIFYCKQFAVRQSVNAMKVSTDSVLLGAWVDATKANNILDIGAGTGILSMMCAQKNPDASITAVEVDPLAAEECADNFQKSVWNSRCQVHADTIQNYALQCDKSFDLIITNPPFFTGGVLSGSQRRDDVRHTKKLPVIDLCNAVRKLLKDDGTFYIILPELEAMRFQEMATQYRLYVSKKCLVLPKPNAFTERVLMCFQKTPVVPQVEQLILEDASGQRSKEYEELVQAFYL